MTPHHTTKERQPGNPVMRWATKVRKDLESRGEQRKSLNALHGLDNRMLKDIGINRSEINAAVYGGTLRFSR